MSTILPSNATNNITGMFSYLQWVQEASDNIFMPSILLGIFVVLFVMLKSVNRSSVALLGSSFICMITAIIFSTLGFLAPMYMYSTILITAISAVWVYSETTE